MQVGEGTTDQLFKTLAEYNPTTNAVMEKIAKALIPLGLALLSILFLIELSNMQKKFPTENGGLSIEVLTDLAMKYVIAYILVMSSGYLIDAIVWFTIQGAKWVNSVLAPQAVGGAIPKMGKVSFWAKPLVGLFYAIAYFSLWLSEVVAKILIFLRGIQLYILKALAPILIAFFVHDELRSIAIGFVKQVMAYALQGILLVLLLGLIPTIAANDFLSLSKFEGGIWQGAGALVQNIMTFVAVAFKYGIITFLLVGSQGLAKRLIGAM
ncbi:type III secretion system protein PrgH [Enterococcus faecalis]|jgi:hypothetical protein|uniref:type IV secretion system protein n=1 Tax=Enterococcus TaxID=1350 RepID=UPI00033095AA|nr:MULTISPECIES: type IV secretion system protein [Enterococcus]MBU5554456.1 type III secretion system protein PrgH [Enterococcus sp. S157_ASV_20]EGO2614905.1 type III secretion system protein PrgH [Enterococcus faecalis]EHR4740338.1 type III secretion system protein PrgH [Enterococcus faecalis]EHU4988830.1 type III secretion system protein PrgH [Enterococcus faecalis]EJB2780982.1 type III secretion system protein PrgH [Enterococcus faecalis]